MELEEKRGDLSLFVKMVASSTHSKEHGEVLRLNLVHLKASWLEKIEGARIDENGFLNLFSLLFLAVSRHSLTFMMYSFEL